MDMSGRAMIEALIAGESDPAKLTRLAEASQQDLRQALRGRLRKHRRFLLRLHLNQIDVLDYTYREFDGQVEARPRALRTDVEQVASIPSVKETRGTGHCRQDRHPHEPVPFRRASHLMAWYQSAQGRELQDDTHAACLSRSTQASPTAAQ